MKLLLRRSDTRKKRNVIAGHISGDPKKLKIIGEPWRAVELITEDFDVISDIAFEIETRLMADLGVFNEIAEL